MVTAETWMAAGGNILGFIDRLEPTHVPKGFKAVSEQRFLAPRSRATLREHRLLFGLGSVDADSTRLSVAHAFILKGFVFDNVLHPMSNISSTAQIAQGTVVFAGAIVAANAQVGPLCIVNHNAIIDHDTVLEKGVHAAPGSIVGGGAVVGQGSMIGSGAVIMQGVRVARGCTIGAGAVVIRDLDPDSRVAGNPARQIRSTH